MLLLGENKFPSSVFKDTDVRPNFLILYFFYLYFSMDMGEALDTNKEMVTVGISNLMSGCSFGFTGKFIKWLMWHFDSDLR